MKKILLTVFIFSIICLSFISLSSAEERAYINIGGYTDYPPFGYIHNDKDNEWRSVFSPIVDNMFQEIKKEHDFQTYQGDETEKISNDISSGEIDMFIGAYNQTNRFDKLIILYPSIFSNPITFFTLPSKTADIKTSEDLKKLKGVRYSKEIYTDFIENKLSELNLEKVDTTYDMFAKLFTRQADYILSSYYFGFISAIKLGVSRQISFSKTPLWNIPVFVGVSAKSKFRDTIIYHIKRYFEDEKVIADVKGRLQQIIDEFEKEYSGVVPPAFNTTPDAEQTTPQVQEQDEAKDENQSSQP